MTNRRRQFVYFWIAIIIATFVVPATVNAQRRLMPQELRARDVIRINVNGHGIGLPGRIGGNENELETDSKVGLNTNARLEETLKTAERYREDGNYRVATQLWQAVLEQSGDALSTPDGTKYYSLVDEVERILAALPEDGLQVYRITSDASAREVMAQSEELSRNTALNQVVQRFFLSSLGDDAAFELGCNYLDQFDFIGARRMFEKIVNRYPDPTVPAAQVYVRIALCYAFLDEPELSENMLALATESGGEEVYAQVRLIRESIGNLSSRTASVAKSSWSCRLGDAKRHGVMLGLPSKVMQSPLAAVWQYYYEPSRSYRNFAAGKGNTLVGEDSYSKAAENSINGQERTLISSWKSKKWRPAGHLLFDTGTVYFKSGVDLIAWDSEAISTAIRKGPAKAESAIEWRSLWRNSFIMDDASKMMQAIRQNFGNYGRRRGAVFNTNQPSVEHEVFLFGDEIFSQFSICDGNLYSIEGVRFDDRSSNASKPRPAQWNTAVRRTRSNFLTAYDAEEGKTLWTLPREPSQRIDPEKEEPDWLESGGFMSAPVGYGKLVLAPVNQGGSISIYAFDPAQQGKTVWKAFLCDEPETGARPWPAINLSLEGSDLFVSCGTGVIFILDPSTGTVRFARRYERSGKADQTFRQLNWSNVRTIFDGWSNDTVIPYGRQMICFCSDTNHVNAYDRNTGDIVWSGPNNPKEFEVDYLLGVFEGVLYAAGRETVIAIDLDGEGRMLWGGGQIFDGKISHGRGVLTTNGVYIPVGGSIYHFDLKGKKNRAVKLNSVDVELGTNAPVGNLYSDGERFWVHGANRIYALANVKKQQTKKDK